ncbi:MAG: hypothetical protein HZB41_00430 [Ignavibacteriae bacterium]|nr:hypothetical protein [Ignavibacteriota bacterium]
MIKVMQLKTTFTIVLIFLIYGCGDSGTDSNDSKNEIWPLAVGNTWTYFVYSYHRYNKDTVKQYDTITHYVSGKKTIAGEDWYFVTSVGRRPNMIFTNRKDGLWGYEFKDSTNINVDSAKLGFKYPTYLNETHPNDSDGIKTISLNSAVITPAGKFNCIKYIYIKRPSEEIYLCPGVGLIKTEQITHINTNVTPPDTIWIRTLLSSYVLNPMK